MKMSKILERSAVPASALAIVFAGVAFAKNELDDFQAGRGCAPNPDKTLLQSASIAGFMLPPLWLTLGTFSANNGGCAPGYEPPSAR